MPERIFVIDSRINYFTAELCLIWTFDLDHKNSSEGLVFTTYRIFLCILSVIKVLHKGKVIEPKQTGLPIAKLAVKRNHKRLDTLLSALANGLLFLSVIYCFQKEWETASYHGFCFWVPDLVVCASLEPDRLFVINMCSGQPCALWFPDTFSALLQAATEITGSHNCICKHVNSTALRMVLIV